MSHRLPWKEICGFFFKKRGKFFEFYIKKMKDRFGIMNEELKHKTCGNAGGLLYWKQKGRDNYV
jgi:hypothetical protein